MNERKLVVTSVSVGIVCASGAQYLARCIESLRHQRQAPEFEIIVVCAPQLPDIEATHQRFPEARFVVNHGQRTPLELASRAVRECRGELILLTKDYCVPSPDWVHAMVDAQRKGRAVVGGRVEIDPDASATEWAYFFVDFFPYAAPVMAGTTPSVTVCNVAYKREELDAIRHVWEDSFVETAINEALRARFGTLWLTPASEVTIYRPMTLREAVSERYMYGRLFAYSRLGHWSLARRFAYVLGTPLLPFLLLGRMASAAFGSWRNGSAFIRSFAPLALMVLARCWGEWLAYFTGRYQRL